MKYFSAAVVLCVHANGLSLTRSDRYDNPESSLVESGRWTNVFAQLNVFAQQQQQQRLDVSPDQLEEGRQEEGTRYVSLESLPPTNLGRSDDISYSDPNTSKDKSVSTKSSYDWRMFGKSLARHVIFSPMAAVTYWMLKKKIAKNFFFFFLN